MTAKTKNFGLEYLVPGEPVYTTRAVMQRNAESIDAALTRGPASPPATQDLLALASRVTAFETAPVARWRRSANYKLVNGVFTLIPWDLKDFDTAGMIATTPASTIRVQRAGYYQINAQVGITAPVQGRLVSRVMRYPAAGGAAVMVAGAAETNSNMLEHGPTAAAVARLELNDSIQYEVFQDGAGGDLLTSATDWAPTMLSLAWLRP